MGAAEVVATTVKEEASAGLTTLATRAAARRVVLVVSVVTLEFQRKLVMAAPTRVLAVLAVRQWWGSLQAERVALRVE